MSIRLTQLNGIRLLLNDDDDDDVGDDDLCICSAFSDKCFMQIPVTRFQFVGFVVVAIDWLKNMQMSAS